MTKLCNLKPISYLTKCTLILPYIAIALIFPITAVPSGPGDSEMIVSRYAPSDFALSADPESKEWKGIKGVIAEKNSLGQVVAGHRTEIRSRWTATHLYLLFLCPYEELHLKPSPATDSETNRLWNWDVAEAFIGTDFKNIKHYLEFQVSPQGEWVDLDIHRQAEPPSHDWRWNSGFEVKAKLDRENRIWYGEMKIPMNRIDTREPAEGLLMRVNFYRLQGPPSNHKGIAWRPTQNSSYHIPEAFGQLILGK